MLVALIVQLVFFIQFAITKKERTIAITQKNDIAQKPMSESKKIESENNYFTEVKVKTDLSTLKTVDKSAVSLVFEKNGIRFEIQNLSSAELIQIIGMS